MTDRPPNPSSGKGGNTSLDHVPKLWSKSQRQAYDHLREIAEVFFLVDCSQAELRPRLDPLLVAPTGSGKSHLVRLLAQSIQIPLLRLSYAEWIVMGARETPRTFARINEFVERNERGIIHIDELDKFRGYVSDWSVAVHIELFLLLDRSIEQPGRSFNWTPDIGAKLRRSFLVIGSGTWQSIWDACKDKQITGFGKSAPSRPDKIQRDIEKGTTVPRELLRRFSSEVVLMPPGNEDDYRAGASMFGLDKIAQDLGLELDYRDAVEKCLGARWLEEQYAKLLRASRKMGKPLFPPRPVVTEKNGTEAEVEPQEEFPF